MKKRKIPYITIILIIINVLIFLGIEMQGSTEDLELLLDCGAMYVPYVLEYGEWYRVIYHIFLHYGFEHLLNNMFMLAVVGSELELMMSKWKFMAIYFLGGIGGTILSGYFEMVSEEYTVGVGASGAIMALAGAYILIMLKNNGGKSKPYAIRLLIILALMVFGNMEEGVDWMAHLGGAVTGLILGAIPYRKKRKKINE